MANDVNITSTDGISAAGGLSAGKCSYFDGSIAIGISPESLGSRLLYVNGYTRVGGVEFLSGVTYSDAIRTCSLEDKTNNCLLYTSPSPRDS